MRRGWQSYAFKQMEENEMPSLSILDFAIIPLRKPQLKKGEEKNQREKDLQPLSGK